MTPPSTEQVGVEDLLREVAAATAGVVGASFLRELTEAVARALGAEIAFVAELDRNRPGHAIVVARWGRDGLAPPEGTRFEIADTPCSLTDHDDTVVLESGACAAYPIDTLVAEHGLDSYAAVVVRGHDGRRLGHIGVMARRPLRLDEPRLAALRIFGHRVAAELERRHDAELLRDRERRLVASRARLVRAADDERRRIGRNLHDGAQQQLVSLGFAIDAARRALGSDPEVVDELLAGVRQLAEEASAQLRRLARGLHPHGLAESGLEVALRRVALSSAIPVALDVDLGRRLPDALELALFYTVAESITNALKHADATRVRVAIARAGDEVVASIEDDGCGGAGAEPGSGLDGIGDRVEALGGRMEVDSGPRAGTRVRVRLPLAGWAGPEPRLEAGLVDRRATAVEEIRDGRKTATVAPAALWQRRGGPPPVGRCAVVVGPGGSEVGRVEITRVEAVALGAVDEATARADLGADFTDLDAWRRRRREDFARQRSGLATLDDDELLLVVWHRPRAADAA